ncbi:acyltransferase family protein [Enterobacter hormaechei]|uniref:acyltransferase family protein n=1 Tax=Enterobacter hormaechei TaxID=158836 RepID=UPI002FF57D83|nr:acyltransferase [Enterobacter hormaechei]
MIFGLQYLRGLAALLVVLLHAKVAVNHFVPSSKLLLPDQGFIEFGKFGVDIFFVISGMVMYMTIGKSLGSDRGIGNFIIKRLIRVVPAFWMALALYGTAMLFVGKMPDDAFRKYLTSALFMFYPNAEGKPETVYGISWTLNFEVYFYMSLALMCCIFGRYGRIATGLLFTVYAYTFYNWGSLNFLQRSVFSPIYLEFILGMLCGYAHQNSIFKNSLISLGMFLSGAVLISATNIWGVGDGGIGRVIYAGIPSMLCVLGMTNLSLPNEKLIHKVLMSFGDASYSVYLIHSIAFVMLSVSLKNIGYQMTDYNDTIILYAVMVIFSVVCSILFHKTLERPVINFINSIWYPSNPTSKSAVM